jgi:transcriptional regulator with XRE-family HTH domain
MATSTETPTLGEYLKGWRVWAELSQSDLAARMGKIDVPRISEIENGRESLPSVGLIVRWMEACGAPLPWTLPKGRFLSSLDDDASQAA